MAIAVFGDIHGNLEALEAILNDVHKRRKFIKEIYFLGDAITFGPDSSACLKMLAKHNVKCVVGNHEQRMIRYETSVSEMNYEGIKHMEYIYHSLDNDDLRFIKSMPEEINITYKGYRLTFAHYSHDFNGVCKEDYDVFSEAILDQIFEGSDCDIVFFGHQHVRKLLINPEGRSYFCLGSSGCVHGDKTYYTYFDEGNLDSEAFIVGRINVEFDRKKLEQKFIREPIPQKIKWAKKHFGIDLVDEPTLPNAK